MEALNILETQETLPVNKQSHVGSPSYAPLEVCQELYKLAAEKSADERASFEAWDDEMRGKQARKVAGQEVKMVPIPKLPAYCEKLGISTKELLLRCGYRIDWCNDEARELDSLISQMSTGKQENVKRLMLELTHPFWLPTEADELLDAKEKVSRISPTRRLIAALNDAGMWHTQKNQAMKEVGAARWSVVNAGHIRLALRDIIHMADTYDLPLSWLLLWTDTGKPVLSTSAMSEFIVTGYLFSGKREQNILRNYIKGARLK